MYLIIPFVPNLPPIAIYIGTYTWICSHGKALILIFYIFVSRTIPF